MPWRAENLDLPHPDPYAVLVSELMLQQTQVVTVIPYFQRWMDRFPDAQTLAQADSEEIHRHWQGLGYYRRATHLQNAARAIAQGGWPADLEGLLALPGLGPYTAAALASIAFQMPEPALDGNAFRVLARLLGIQEDPRQQAAILRTWLRPALSSLGPSRMTQALMELGALICTPAPRCGNCPLISECVAYRDGLTDQIPPPKPRTQVRDIHLQLLALESEGHWLLQPPRQKGLLAGLWCWPSLEEEPATGTEERTTAIAAENAHSYNALELRNWEGWIQTYSHRREHVHPCSIQLPGTPKPRPGLRWIPSDQLANLPMGKRDQRLRELLAEPFAPQESGDLVLNRLASFLTKVIAK